MPATPAWPPHSLPRLFVDQPLAKGTRVTLDIAPAHYLATVLRLGEGAQVKLFDDRTGEWLARIVESGRKRVTLTIFDHLRPRDTMPDVWLLFAPLKRDTTDWLVEKATELGAERLLPILTHRSIAQRVNSERLRAISIEAAEQCDRTSLPAIAEPARLAKLLRDWPKNRTLLFADEAGGVPLAQAAKPGPAAILIGPEGGFTDEERGAIRAIPSAVPVSLGPRILRAETAALTALSLWMGAAGDWDRPPRT